MPWPGNLTEPFEQADRISEERLCVPWLLSWMGGLKS